MREACVGSDAFGTLSFDDDEDSGSSEFETLHASFWATRAAYVSGAISHSLAARRFQALRLSDSSGDVWTLGPTSASWYVRSPGGQWRRSESPPVGVSPVLSGSDAWLSIGIESFVREDGSDDGVSSTVDDETGFNPFQRKSLPLIDSSAGSLRPSLDADVAWVYEDWEEGDADFSAGAPESLSPAAAVDGSFGAAPVDRDGSSGESFDIDDLFLRPE